MKLWHRIKGAVARSGSSSGPALGGGATGATLGLGQIEAAERQEFPPEEPAEDEREESE